MLTLLNTPDIVNKASAGLVLLAALVVAIHGKVKKKTATLEEVVTKSIAAGALPTAVVLMWGALDHTILSSFAQSLHIEFAAAGVALVYVSIKALTT